MTKRLGERFEDLSEVEGHGLELVVRTIAGRTLAMALRTASHELRAKFRATMSAHGADLLDEEDRLLGVVRLASVAEAQQAVVECARHLEAENKIHAT